MYSENVLGIGALNEGEALANLLDALSIAEEAARQLALYTNQPHWMLAANQLTAAEGEGAYRFIASDDPQQFLTLGRRFLGSAIERVEVRTFG